MLLLALRILRARPLVMRSLRPGAAQACPSTDVQAACVRVRGGYEPDTLVARAGEPLRITFRREETAGCSECVVFPAFGRSVTLPPFEDVTVELLPEQPGEYEFTCRLGMLRGRLMVE